MAIRPRGEEEESNGEDEVEQSTRKRKRICEQSRGEEEESNGEEDYEVEQSTRKRKRTCEMPPSHYISISNDERQLFLELFLDNSRGLVTVRNRDYHEQHFWKDICKEYNARARAKGLNVHGRT